jgi:putative colanic acid biosynthesis acetyltransferase WcaF
VTDTQRAAAPMRRDLSRFTTAGYDKGRSRAVQALWFATMNLVFFQWWCPAAVRVSLLKLFGARVGERVLIRHRVRILWPWKLSIGDNSWIGEGAWLLNLEPIGIGANVCVSQEAFLCTGGHDHRSEDFRYRNAPIVVGDGAWIGARAVVLPGVTVGVRSVVGATTTVTRDVPPDSTSLNSARSQTR